MNREQLRQLTCDLIARYGFDDQEENAVKYSMKRYDEAQEESCSTCGMRVKYCNCGRTEQNK